MVAGAFVALMTIFAGACMAETRGVPLEVITNIRAVQNCE
jgi:hypothetical protein